jgi:DNA-binding response OmpR family regulator
LMMVRQTRPDLVLLDLILPDQNGYYICEALRRDAATACIPIIMMTALPGEIPRFAGIEAGADAYLNKPFSNDGLVALVDDLLQETPRRPVAFKSPPAGWKEPARSRPRAFA